MTRAQPIGSTEACLVSRNDPMHGSVPYLRNSLPDDAGILHEYFIPRSQFVSFVDGMRMISTRSTSEKRARGYCPDGVRRPCQASRT